MLLPVCYHLCNMTEINTSFAGHLQMRYCSKNKTRYCSKNKLSPNMYIYVHRTPLTKGCPNNYLNADVILPE